MITRDFNQFMFNNRIRNFINTVIIPGLSNQGMYNNDIVPFKAHLYISYSEEPILNLLVRSNLPLGFFPSNPDELITKSLRVEGKHVCLNELISTAPDIYRTTIPLKIFR